MINQVFSKSFLEQKNLKKKEILDKEKQGEVYKKFKDIFVDVELMDVQKKD